MTEPLSPEQVNQAASELTAARLAVDLIPSLGSNAPSDVTSAYQIADAHAEQLGWSVAGWKVGCTSALAREILSSPGPFPGRVFDGTVHEDGILQHDTLDKPLLESEFGFFLGSDLPPRDTPYSVEDVKAAVSSVAPAFELVTSRYEDWQEVSYLSVTADSASNGGAVFGEPIPIDDCPHLSEIAVTLDIDGEEIASGSGSDILGDPWLALEWLANDLSSRGLGLIAGQFVLSGTCTGAIPFPEGTTATATFTTMGKVTVTRTAP